MTPSREVLRMHVDLRDRLENPLGPLGRSVGYYAQHQYDDSRAGATLAETLYRHTLYARDYHVEEKMVDLAVRRAEDPEHFTGTEQFGQFEAPFAMGFLVFGKPLETIEVQGRTQKAVAMTWGPAEAKFESGDPPVSGRFVVFWSNLYRAVDDIHRESMLGIDTRVRSDDTIMSPAEFDRTSAMLGGWAPTLMDFIPFDARIGPPRIEVPLERRQLATIKGRPWAREGTSNYARIVASLWELMSETLSTAHTEPLDRTTRRWAARAKIATDITVIKLRREAQHTISPGSGTPLQYRVPVNGHNRTYHRGTPDEYTIWIRDHERGPKDAPYRANRKVYNLVR